MPSYVQEIRRLVGNRPLILPGTNVFVVDRSDRLLLMKRGDTGDWGLPGGFMELGETVEETARREVLEETGLTIGDMEFMRIFSGPECYYQYPNGDVVYSVIATYLTRDFSGTLGSRSTEVSDLAFFNMQDQPVQALRATWPRVEECLRYIGPRNGFGPAQANAGSGGG
jgi:ADP-ribose pyrophosphatase YjhB (NUDIX family)